MPEKRRCRLWLWPCKRVAWLFRRIPLDSIIKNLCELPGIGPWTAHYIAMRGYRDPDAFPHSDLGLLRALETENGRPSPAAMLMIAEAWRPWRAYAAMRLWAQP
ncbi:DNA-3-methyladenine glycosylase family protein [Acidithiobacillus ferriphilus]|uniref:DNA-3-methyladenine glycosylase family protein n=1 Tax=Acidithiobacillus ferriphilus TaxID=1689834 RepID=UPI00242DE53C|nr:hypothetical protein [Acidithiobacillus ferriphilus]